MVQGLRARSTRNLRPNLGEPLHAALGWLQGELDTGLMLVGQDVPAMPLWQYLLELPRGEVRGAIENFYPHHLHNFQAADYLSQSWIFASLERLVDLLRDLRPRRILVEPEVKAILRVPEGGAAWHTMAPDLAVDGDAEEGWVLVEVKSGARSNPASSDKMNRYLTGMALRTHVEYPERWRVAKCVWISFATHDAKGNLSPSEPVVNVDTQRFNVGEIDRWCTGKFGISLKGLFRAEEQARLRMREEKGA